MGSKGIVASSAAMGIVLQAGIGDTIRYSLTPEPGEPPARARRRCANRRPQPRRHALQPPEPLPQPQQRRQHRRVRRHHPGAVDGRQHVVGVVGGRLGPDEPDPSGDPLWGDFVVTLLDHSLAVQTTPNNRFGSDRIAGGAGDDMVFGQLGNDIIEGGSGNDTLMEIGRAHV